MKEHSVELTRYRRKPDAAESELEMVLSGVMSIHLAVRCTSLKIIVQLPSPLPPKKWEIKDGNFSARRSLRAELSHIRRELADASGALALRS